MQPTDHSRAWYHELNGYHWLVLILCTLGWTFDCLDQQLFALSRSPAIAELKNLPEMNSDVKWWGTMATSLMLIGWATGGIIFGICGDKVGRVKTLVLTVTVYAIFTGLCGVAGSLWQFLLFRFLTGLGIGGAFGACATLVAETMPQRARPHALGVLQAVAALGNIAAALITIGLSEMVANKMLLEGWATWRWSFLIGLFPLLITPIAAIYLSEPESWRRARQEALTGGRKTGSMLELFGDHEMRRRVILGMLLAMVGVIGFWGIMLFAVDLNRSVGRKEKERQLVAAGDRLDHEFLALLAEKPERIEDAKKAGVNADWLLSIVPQGSHAQSPQQAFAAIEKSPNSGAAIAAAGHSGEAPPREFDQVVAELKERKAAIDKEVGWWGGLTSILINAGGFFGVYAFAFVTSRIGRRPAFSIFLAAAFVSTLAVFLLANNIWKIYALVPLMGFSLLSLMGGYTIYFPELFPTRLRATAISFCYNVGRYLAAGGPAVLGLLTGIYASAGVAEPFRYAAASLCPIFLLGILIIWRLPETRGLKLPD